MKNDEILKIEQAKSYFKLAQIIIILAGFAFTSAGLFYNNSQMIMIQSTAIGNSLIIAHEQLYNGSPPPGDLDYIYNTLKPSLDEISLKNRKWSLYTLMLGGLLTLFSLSLWRYGKSKLPK